MLASGNRKEITPSITHPLQKAIPTRNCILLWSLQKPYHRTYFLKRPWQILNMKNSLHYYGICHPLPTLGLALKQQKKRTKTGFHCLPFLHSADSPTKIWTLKNWMQKLQKARKNAGSICIRYTVWQYLFLVTRWKCELNEENQINNFC